MYGSKVSDDQKLRTGTKIATRGMGLATRVAFSKGSRREDVYSRREVAKLKDRDASLLLATRVAPEHEENDHFASLVTKNAN